MRIILPSATIAAFSGACLVSADKATKEHVLTNDAIQSQIVQDVNKSYSQSSTSSIRQRGDECDALTNQSSNTAVASSGRESADVGVLGCVVDQTCEADDTSSTGGRCTTVTSSATQRPQTPVIPVFPKRRHNTLAKQRFLQRNSTATDELFVCPANCPQDFCDCASQDGDGEKCAPQLHSVCENDLLSECVPDKYLQFYEETYCPFAACLHVENKPYEECSCTYYRDYCDIYYAFEESIEKCAISTCCEGQEAGTKYTCLPGLEPTFSPTLAPTVSLVPSAAPTTTTMPSVSTHPTISTAPTVSPSFSALPTVTAMPTPAPTDTPSGQPTVSAEPTTTPTRNPTLKPTKSPTTSPTPSPSDMPSSSPTDFPSTSPTISLEPTTSSPPTLSPSTSMPPTISSSPTDAPSISAAPTNPPSLLPTVSMPPTSSPSTTAPTMNPTESPSKVPTGSPSDSPSKQPMTAIPTEPPSQEPPTTTSPTGPPVFVPVDAPAEGTLPEDGERAPPAPGSGGSAVRAGVVTLFVGVGGALWLFA